jgi:N utilization substance protein B
VSGPGVDPQLRKRARRRAVQAIYAWQMSGNDMASVLRDFAHEQDMEQADLDYFNALTRGVEQHARRWTRPHAAARPHHRPGRPDRSARSSDSPRSSSSTVPTCRTACRLNEAVELAKRFGSEHGHTFVNGVLDQAAQSWRAGEYRR